MSDPIDLGPGSGGVTRRQVLAGAASVAAVAVMPAAFAGKQTRQAMPAPDAEASALEPVRRYMAASAVLPDGRILITGGYSRPWSSGPAPQPLSSALLYDPGSDSWQILAEMTVPRARHASLALRDGRVAVFGGVSRQATASVEIYDPRTNAWTEAPEMASPRYDHTASLVGEMAIVLGGSSTETMSGLERYRF